MAHRELLEALSYILTVNSTRSWGPAAVVSSTACPGTVNFPSSVTDKNSKRHFCAGTSGARLLVPPSGTRQRTRLARGVHAYAWRGAAVSAGAHPEDPA